MQRLRHALDLTRFVLVWFVLSLGVAVASPMVQPKALDLVCTSSGSVKLIAVGDDDEGSTTHLLDCPLCAASAAPLALMRPAPSFDSPLAQALRPLVAAHLAAATAPPLPSRGPRAHRRSADVI
jgi:hypothetical protein